MRGSWWLNKDCNILTSQPLRTSPCVVLVILGCSTRNLGAQPLWDMFSFRLLVTHWSGLQTQSGSQRPLLSGGGFLYHILSLTHLISNSLGGPEGPFCRVVAFSTISFSNFSGPQLTDILSTPSYIIVQSPTQSLEWHVWSSSSGNNCHAVHRSLSSGSSVYECTMGFLPCPIFFSQACQRDFLS